MTFKACAGSDAYTRTVKRLRLRTLRLRAARSWSMSFVSQESVRRGRGAPEQKEQARVLNAGQPAHRSRYDAGRCADSVLRNRATSPAARGCWHSLSQRAAIREGAASPQSPLLAARAQGCARIGSSSSKLGRSRECSP